MALGKKKKEELKKLKVEEQAKPIKPTKESDVLGRGMITNKDIFAPPSIDRSNPDFLKVGNKYVRSFVMNGFPSQVSVGWLDAILNSDADIDTSIYVEPADERGALDELTRKITQFEAQLANELEKGNIKNITRLRNNISDLYTQRESLEQNYENLFYIQIAANLHTDSEDELNKQSQMLDNRLKGRRISLMPAYLKQDEAYKTVLPYGKMYVDDMLRNFNSGALTACFPFYNSEISHKDGVFMGVNLATSTPVFVNFYDRALLANSNFTVFGKSGSGKTFFVSLLTLRSALKGIRTTIIDPEGEYVKLTKALGGSHVYIAPDSPTRINPFDLEEEEDTDENGNPNGQKIVRLKDKVADVLNLIAVMAGGLSREQASLVSTVISEVYKQHGFTEDAKSLYINKESFDNVTGEFYMSGDKKPMPTFSEFHNLLLRFAESEKSSELQSLANSLGMFKKGGVYDMFDCQTSAEIDFHNSPVITFDISKLEESILRPIGMYIALSWTWEKFVKKNPETKKRIICDEAWMLVNKNMAGHEYTAQFLDKTARRIRKRNGGLLVASQNFIEFENNEQGKAVITNASLNIFLKQDASDIDAVQNTFKLSDGEKAFLLRAKTGEMLIKAGEESSVAFALSFPYERDLISGK